MLLYAVMKCRESSEEDREKLRWSQMQAMRQQDMECHLFLLPIWLWFDAAHAARASSAQLHTFVAKTKQMDTNCCSA